MRLHAKALATIAALVVASPAYADPISLSVAALAAVGTQTATLLAIAVTSFVLTTVASLALSFVMTKLFAPKRNAQERQASIISISLPDEPAAATFADL